MFCQVNVNSAGQWLNFNLIEPFESDHKVDILSKSQRKERALKTNFITFSN